MHALIIEDESLIAMAIEDVLRECGFTSFDIAASTQSAIEAAARRSPDLITTDVQLEPGCGMAAVEVIREGPPVPIIFITGHAAEVARRLPQYRVVEKPVHEPALIAAVAATMLEIAAGGVRMWADAPARWGSRPPLTN